MRCRAILIVCLFGGTLVSGRAVDPEDAQKLMVRNGCLPTTVFQKATAPWPCICDRCKEHEHRKPEHHTEHSHR
jgi:hypothetical protein